MTTILCADAIRYVTVSEPLECSLPPDAKGSSVGEGIIRLLAVLGERPHFLRALRKAHTRRVLPPVVGELATPDKPGEVLCAVAGLERGSLKRARFFFRPEGAEIAQKLVNQGSGVDESV